MHAVQAAEATPTTTATTRIVRRAVASSPLSTISFTSSPVAPRATSRRLEKVHRRLQRRLEADAHERHVLDKRESVDEGSSLIGDDGDVAASSSARAHSTGVSVTSTRVAAKASKTSSAASVTATNAPIGSGGSEEDDSEEGACTYVGSTSIPRGPGGALFSTLERIFAGERSPPAFRLSPHALTKEAPTTRSLHPPPRPRVRAAPAVRAPLAPRRPPRAVLDRLLPALRRRVRRRRARCRTGLCRRPGPLALVRGPLALFVREGRPADQPWCGARSTTGWVQVSAWLLFLIGILNLLFVRPLPSLPFALISRLADSAPPAQGLALGARLKVLRSLSQDSTTPSALRRLRLQREAEAAGHGAGAGAGAWQEFDRERDEPPLAAPARPERPQRRSLLQTVFRRAAPDAEPDSAAGAKRSKSRNGPNGIVIGAPRPMAMKKGGEAGVSVVPPPPVYQYGRE
ncbi:hypothetical protein DMC30DRAFT_392860 [Rhodotorula diobovata]|uniref:Uncharacterized protein n=1 Tax=Rhodotorula diobovata TaxID=5288 RepID=A0A5C5FZ99_9BASI|nr:hypothetical protein DMC30DRAFT_392860 [Rhodotorula diobovata]